MIKDLQLKKGYFRTWRVIADHKIYNKMKFDHFHAWFDLILLASHKINIVTIKGTDISINPGQLCYSQLSLMKRWKWDKKTVKRLLNWLENEEMISQKTVYSEVQNKDNNSLNKRRKLTTLITIINWNFYQGNLEADINDSNYTKKVREDSKRGNKVDDKVVINNNVKNDKNTNIPSVSSEMKKNELDNLSEDVTPEKDKKYFRDMITKYFMNYSGNNDLSFCYNTVDRIISKKDADTKIQYGEKCDMLFRILMDNQHLIYSVTVDRFIGIIINKYKDFSYKQYLSEYKGINKVNPSNYIPENEKDAGGPSWL